MNQDFGATGESATPYARDAAFEQLLRQAASHSSRRARAAKTAREAANSAPRVEEIRIRAYQIYIGRGGSDGRDLDDWLQAERQVAEELKRKR